MVEISSTLLIVGAITGFIYSMPIAGPISIIIISRAFQGKLRFCLRTALGAALVESMFVFIIVFGITAFYEVYQPVLPYFLFIGATFVVFVGLKIIKQKTDLHSLETNTIITDKDENRGGLRSGIVINLTNPTLFMGWFIASFVTLSFVSSIGLNIGGLDVMINQNMKSVTEITGSEFKEFENSQPTIRTEPRPEKTKEVNPLVLSLAFALGVGLGAYLWLHLLTKLIIKYRDRIKTSILDKLIHLLGISLIGIGIYLAYRAVFSFFS